MAKKRNTASGPSDRAHLDGPAAALDAAWHVWRLAAEEYLDVLILAGREFSADDLVDEVGLPTVTGSPNAIGALFAAAVGRGDIKQVGWRRSQRRSRHAGVQRVWRGVSA